ncbi:MAG: hypothetical protein ACKVZH_12655 [Blastocatellia bacterium]
MQVIRATSGEVKDDLIGAPSATSWGGNRIDVFARNPAGKVVHFWKEDGTPNW